MILRVWARLVSLADLLSMHIRPWFCSNTLRSIHAFNKLLRWLAEIDIIDSRDYITLPELVTSINADKPSEHMNVAGGL